MGVLSNRIDRASLKRGDHIYSWRYLYIYAHHGIYVGDNMVVHFTNHGQEVGMGPALDRLLTSSMPVFDPARCPTCTPPNEGHGVFSSCLDCFLAGGVLYRYEYSVSRLFFFAKPRGGTCTLAASDPDDVVVHRANYLLEHGFGCYNVYNNNCEDFTIYCKTGLVVVHGKMGRSGQAVLIECGTEAVMKSIPSLMQKANVYTMAASIVVKYCMGRYDSDIGVRRDVAKIDAEDLTKQLPEVIQPQAAILS